MNNLTKNVPKMVQNRPKSSILMGVNLIFVDFQGWSTFCSENLGGS